MKNFKVKNLLIPAAIACSSFFMMACDRGSNSSDQGSEVQGQGVDYNRESVDPGGSYTVIAKDGFTNEKCIQTGSPENNARDRALDLCNGRNSTSMTQPGGVATQEGRPIVNGNGTRVDGQLPSQYICLISEVKGNFDGSDKTFPGVGKTVGEARKAAEEFCAKKGGIRCQVTTCFMADDDKWSWQKD